VNQRRTENESGNITRLFVILAKAQGCPGKFRLQAHRVRSPCWNKVKSSCAGLSRVSTSSLQASKAWMAGSKPGQDEGGRGDPPLFAGAKLSPDTPARKRESRAPSTRQLPLSLAKAGGKIWTPAFARVTSPMLILRPIFGQLLRLRDWPPRCRDEPLLRCHSAASRSRSINRSMQAVVAGAG
jgi:hypothetical protein